MAQGVIENRNCWRVIGWATVALMLAIPLVAMRFTDEVAWSAADFLTAAILLGGAGLVMEVIVRRTASLAYRTAVVVALAAAFLLVWINGAVGIIGSERNDANVLFGIVIATGIAGAAIARLRPRPMGNAMVGMAAAQLLVPPIAYVAMPGERAALGQPEVFVLTFGFAALWLMSAWLFRRAANR